MESVEIFDKIRKWELRAGESFVDYWGSNLNVPNFMFWCVGKGVLTQSQFNIWENDFTGTDSTLSFESNEPCYFIDGEGYLSYCIGDMDNDQFYGLIVLSQFIADSLTYQRRLNEFLEGES